MNKLFVCIVFAMALTGCASSSYKLETAENQVTQQPGATEKPASDSSEIAVTDTDESDFEPVQQAFDTYESDFEPVQQAFDTDESDFEPVQQSLDTDQPYTDKVIYLTFDDGPSGNTPKILDILKQENVKATFFVTGHHENYVHLIKREFEEGHAIGAHSFSHKYEIYASQETYFEDLEKLQKVIEKYTGSRTKLIRFPGGSSNTAYLHYTNDPNFMYNLCKEVRRRGYQYIDWNLSSKDSSSGYVPASTIVTMACRDHSPDICLLMPDTFGKETTVEALPEIIRYYKAQGYRFGTLDTTSSGYHHIHRQPNPNRQHHIHRHHHTHRHHSASLSVNYTKTSSMFTSAHIIQENPYIYF